MIIMDIIITRPELGLNRLVSVLSLGSSKVFHAFFVHLFCNSALHLASCCYSFLIHVDNLICFFLVSPELVLLSTVQKFLHSICGPEGCTRLFFWKFSSRLMSVVLFPPPKGPVPCVLLFLKSYRPNNFPVSEQMWLVFFLNTNIGKVT